MKLFPKIVNGWNPLIIFTKSTILDFLQRSEYTFVVHFPKEYWPDCSRNFPISRRDWFKLL